MFHQRQKRTLFNQSTDRLAQRVSLGIHSTRYVIVTLFSSKQRKFESLSEFFFFFVFNTFCIDLLHFFSLFYLTRTIGIGGDSFRIDTDRFHFETNNSIKFTKRRGSSDENEQWVEDNSLSRFFVIIQTKNNVIVQIGFIRLFRVHPQSIAMFINFLFRLIILKFCGTR